MLRGEKWSVDPCITHGCLCGAPSFSATFTSVELASFGGRFLFICWISNARFCLFDIHATSSIYSRCSHKTVTMPHVKFRFLLPPPLPCYGGVLSNSNGRKQVPYTRGGSKVSLLAAAYWCSSWECRGCLSRSIGHPSLQTQRWIWDYRSLDPNTN
jgi:hypothetical protein